ncbi:MAG: hypothetical protein KFH98_16630, partial [Gemmatimonadetes bacterium]|nr:hypothetical protein [Gemmatimonadota bacterium]
LHAVGIGLMSMVVWFMLNALAALIFGAWEWPSLSAEMTIGLLIVQLAAAVVGALLGYNVALRGQPGLAEHEPLER